MPFEGSRRLTGGNLFFDSPGAMLDTAGVDVDDALLGGWRRRVLRARTALGWPECREQREARDSATLTRAAQRASAVAVRRHAAAVSLALSAPPDQLFTAAEVNEWALCATLVESDPARWANLEEALRDAAREAGQPTAEPTEAPHIRPSVPVAFAAHLPVLEEWAALRRFTALSQIEAAPRLRALIDAAGSRGLLYVLDDDHLTLGSGAGGRTWSLDTLPDVSEAPWGELQDARIALVTGSNGKTTTVRLLAACARAHGWRDGYNCTDGLFVAEEQIASGDYSGPVGARTILRDTRVEAAVLEAARGGLLRRGLAVQRANVAVVTNVSADHFGEYGVDDVAGLADVKLVVASALDDAGLLVLNAEDPTLRARAAQLDCPIGWFARDYDDAMLIAHRMQGGPTCGVRDGRLLAYWTRDAAQSDVDLGAVASMPLTAGGAAEYNVSNIGGAALAALALGVSATTIAGVLARFGADPADNPGRLMRYEYRGAQVIIDYAHNPEGLSGLMNVAASLPRTGRIALLLGQAGNRETKDIEELAFTAAKFAPDFVVIKEMEAYIRGRAPGEVPEILRRALLQAGLREAALEVQSSELAAVQRVLEWARPGDVLVMPVHDRVVREAAIALASG